jgi:hypothetical protein
MRSLYARRVAVVGCPRWPFRVRRQPPGLRPPSPQPSPTSPTPNHPADSARAGGRATLRDDLIRESSTRTVCPWKGTASYYSLEHEGRSSADAVWYYPEPKPDAEMVRDRVAFWKDVTVVD